MTEIHEHLGVWIDGYCIRCTEGIAAGWALLMKADGPHQIIRHGHLEGCYTAQRARMIAIVRAMEFMSRFRDRIVFSTVTIHSERQNCIRALLNRRATQGTKHWDLISRFRELRERLRAAGCEVELVWVPPTTTDAVDADKDCSKGSTRITPPTDYSPPATLAEWIGKAEW